MAGGRSRSRDGGGKQGGRKTALETDGRDESATQPRELTGLVADAGVVGKANASESRMNYDRSVSQPSGTLLVIFCVTSRFYGPSSHPRSRVFLYHRPRPRAATKMPTILLAALFAYALSKFRLDGFERYNVDTI